MKPVKIKLLKKIILDTKKKEFFFKRIYSDSVNIAIDFMDNCSIKTWDLAAIPEDLVKAAHGRLNSEENVYLKKIEKNFPGLPIGPDSIIVKASDGKIEVLKGDLSDSKSFEFGLYLTLEEFILLDSFGDSLLVSVGNQTINLSKGINTFLLPLNDGYNIIHYQTID